MSCSFQFGVTVVFPCHNSSGSIDLALESVLRQKYEDLEVIAIDDASTDGTLDVLKEWRSKLPSLKVIALDHNIGPGPARNRGIEAAKNRYIALLDSDDVWMDDKLEVQMSAHLHQQATISCTGFLFRGKEVLPTKISYQSLLKNNVVNTSTVIFDRQKVEILFESSNPSEDYIAWLDVAKRKNIHAVTQVLARRNDVEGVSGNKWSMARQRWKIYREVEGLSLVSSSYYFLQYAISGAKKHFG